MSRAYRITVSESVRRHIHVADGIRTHLEILAVLDAGTMCELLAAELAARDFRRDGNDMVREDGDGIEIRVAVAGDDAGAVTVRASAERELDFVVRKTRRGYVETEEVSRRELAREVARATGQRLANEEARLSADLAKTLEQKLRDLHLDLDRVANRVTAEALKVRAAQLGEIREVSEDPETGSLTIKVRI